MKKFLLVTLLLAVASVTNAGTAYAQLGSASGPTGEAVQVQSVYSGRPVNHCLMVRLQANPSIHGEEELVGKNICSQEVTFGVLVTNPNNGFGFGGNLPGGQTMVSDMKLETSSAQKVSYLFFACPYGYQAASIIPGGYGPYSDPELTAHAAYKCVVLFGTTPMQNLASNSSSNLSTSASGVVKPSSGSLNHSPPSKSLAAAAPSFGGFQGSENINGYVTDITLDPGQDGIVRGNMSTTYNGFTLTEQLSGRLSGGHYEASIVSFSPNPSPFGWNDTNLIVDISSTKCTVTGTLNSTSGPQMSVDFSSSAPSC